MSTWNSAPQVPNVPPLPPGGEPDLAYVRTLQQYIKTLANVLSALKNDLEFMINGNLSAQNIRAKSITADSLDVDELSAISANLGTVNLGTLIGVLVQASTIIGSYIATSSGTFPRAEMSTASNLFRALSSSTQYVSMMASDPNFSGSPTFLLVDGSDLSGIVQSGATIIGGNTSIRIVPGGFFGTIFLEGPINIQGSSTASGTVYVATTPGGSPTTPISFTQGLRTS